MKKRTIYLKSGGYLKMEGHDVTFVDGDGVQQYLTEAEQTILSMLVSAGGDTVSYQALYEGYSRQTSFGETNQMVADIKTHMHPQLKACIRVVRGRGYRLDRSKFESFGEVNQQKPETDSRLSDAERVQENFAGEYYGFYLDPVGDGSVLGAYLKIESQDIDGRRTMRVNGVMGIRSDHVFLNDALPAAFTGDPSDYYRKYRVLKDCFSANDSRCFSVTGTAHIRGTVAVISVTTTLESEWTILLDIEKFMFVEKQRPGVKYPYKGGLGLMVVLTNSHGKFCCRGALIRKNYMKPAICLTNTDIGQMLKIPGTLNWSPLELDAQLDRKWYNWFMKYDS